MENSESLEMYLEAVRYLIQKQGQARGTDIARHLSVTKPSVTRAMKILNDRGLIVKESYGPVFMTERGIALSEKIRENHRIITRFIMDSLGLDEIEAATNAFRIKHVISEPMLQAIEKVSEDSKKQGQTKNIVEDTMENIFKDQSIRLHNAREIVNLTQAETDVTYTIKEVRTEDEEIKDFLFTLGCYEGQQVTVLSVLAENYIITIKDARYSIGGELAEVILI